MNWFLVVLVLAGLLLVANAAYAASSRSALIRTRSDYWAKKRALDVKVLWAIVLTENPGLDARAYNAEGFDPPAGKPRLSRTIPEGADVTDYQGSFGLAQVFHSRTYSTARAFRPAGVYPRDLLDYDINLEVASAFIADLIRKQYRFPEQSDVYNVGETKYRAGVRNPDYLAKVKANFQGA